MCGIAGVYAQGWNSEQWRDRLNAMGEAVLHRGPDGGDTWSDLDVGIGLVHRRLSIIDLSQEGKQPMTSNSGRYVITYNGEIYNYRELAEELRHEGQTFRGSSDTEVLLAMIERYGIKGASERVSGMYAFAVWDREERSLSLCRDHVGIKPLYYGWHKGCFFFCSELRSIRALKEFEFEIDRDAVSLFFRHNYIPCPWSIYRGIRKLPPGTFATFKPESGDEPKVQNYWSLKEVVEEGRSNPFKGSEADAVQALSEVLEQSVSSHMVSDVPLGAFLSGGIDSSLVVALMQAQRGDRVKTFSIGFDEKGYNEAEHARRVAEHIGSDHTEMYLRSNEVIEKIPHILSFCDEPFADSSQIPTYFVSQLARQSVTVSLSGDGGDEMFSGYVRYLYGETIWNKISKMPDFVRGGVARGIEMFSPEFLETSMKPLRSILPASMRQEHLGDKLHRLAEVIDARSSADLYLGMISHEKDTSRIVRDHAGITSPVVNEMNSLKNTSFIELMMYADAMYYLPDDILTKVDRASMSVSLESRVPLLDRKVMAFAWSLPLAMKNQNGDGKKVLREVLYRHVPREIIDRPKMGFGIPVGQWLKGELRDWAANLLDKKRIEEEGILNAEYVSMKWDDHLSGKKDSQYALWDMLVFENWMQESRER